MTKPDPAPFDLDLFLPYLLNQAAETTSRAFHEMYRQSYGFTRTQWRVLANLAKFGAMTARDICAVSHIEKTMVSRAVAALERDGMLTRIASTEDRRKEPLSLTARGMAAYADMGRRALAFDLALNDRLGTKEAATLERLLRHLIAEADAVLPGAAPPANRA